jgi:hypothetical protein
MDSMICCQKAMYLVQLYFELYLVLIYSSQHIKYVENFQLEQ